MATKADFSEDEWRALQRGVTGAGMLVSVSDADFTDSFGEASALARFLGEQRRTNESELVREIAAVRGGGFGLTASREKVESETMAALRSAVATLSAKAPDEVAAYGQLVLELATGGGRGVGGSDRDGDEGDRQRSRGAPVQLSQPRPEEGTEDRVYWRLLRRAPVRIALVLASPRASPGLPVCTHSPGWPPGIRARRLSWCVSRRSSTRMAGRGLPAFWSTQSICAISVSLRQAGPPSGGPREFLSARLLRDERAVHKELDQSRVEVGGFHLVGAFEGVDLEAVVRGLRVEDRVGTASSP